MASKCGELTSDAVPGAPRKTPEFHKLIENDVKKCETKENKDIKASITTTETTPIENTSRTEQTNFKHSKEKKSQPKNTKPQNTNIFVVNSNQVHFGTVNNYNYSSSSSDCRKRSNDSGIPCTAEIRRVLNCKATTSKAHCELVAEHLGLEWRKIGHELGYTEGQMDRFYEDNKTIGLKEVIYQMLLDWIQEGADQASLGHLATILWDLNQKIIVQRLVKFV